MEHNRVGPSPSPIGAPASQSACQHTPCAPHRPTCCRLASDNSCASTSTLRRSTPSDATSACCAGVPGQPWHGIAARAASAAPRSLRAWMRAMSKSLRSLRGSRVSGSQPGAQDAWRRGGVGGGGSVGCRVGGSAHCAREPPAIRTRTGLCAASTSSTNILLRWPLKCTPLKLRPLSPDRTRPTLMRASSLSAGPRPRPPSPRMPTGSILALALGFWREWCRDWIGHE